MFLAPVARPDLIKARTQAGLTQRELAEQLGTNQTTISRWEQGIVSPSAYYKKRLSQFFGLSPSALGLDDPDQALPFGEERIESIPLVGQLLIGRELELEQIRQLLARRLKLITISGLPGVGKTALVVALARDPHIREQFPDGVLWAGLGPAPNRSIFRRWGEKLGVTEAEQALLLTAADWEMALRHAIGSRRILLIIDDAWKEETALSFQVGGNNCAHIVTTRFSSIASSIASHTAVTLQELNEEQSLLFLRSLAPDIVERAQEEVQKLITAVGGLPLALKLIGNYLRKEGRNGQPRRIKAALADLQQIETRLQLAQARSPDEPHAQIEEETSVSLYSLIKMSDRHLSTAARTALYALAVFVEKPATFSEEAALAVAYCTVEDLDELNDNGLLEVSGERYSLHQVVADYARIHFRCQPEALVRETYRRLVDHTLAYALRYQKDMDKLNKECYLYRVALNGADEQGYHLQFVQLAGALATYIRSCMIYAVEFYLIRALEIAQTIEDDEIYPSVIKIVEERARMRLLRGDRSMATSLVQTGRLLAERAHDEKALSILQALLNQEEGHVAILSVSQQWCEAHPFASSSRISSESSPG